MREVTDKLVDDGVKIFSDAFDKLLDAIQRETEAPRPPVAAIRLQGAAEAWRLRSKRHWKIGGWARRRDASGDVTPPCGRER